VTGFRHALVLGKFYPPHAGHHHLIRAAASRSARTTVVALASRVESIPIEDRVAWLAEEHAGDPGVVVLGDRDDHPVDFDDDAVWEGHVAIVRAVLGRRAILDGDPGGAAVDAVFSSEPYGEELARRLGAVHVPVDPGRGTHPVSGTAVRADPRGHWRFLAPATRRGLAARIIVIGAESTGTTTLSRQLAEHYRAPWVAEYGRRLTELKLAAERSFDPTGRIADLTRTLGDFFDVARQQQLNEDAAVAGPVLVGDNDAWAAMVWGHRYLGEHVPEIGSGTRRPALYLLTDHAGVPFEDDGLRDSEHLREWMTGRFREELDARGVPWALISGDREERLRRAVAACDTAIESHFRFADPLG
jgi:NadR type nicotinamide-nucleotide adenylyltransferase